MYRITIQTLTGNEHTIYFPGSEEYTVTSAVLSLSVGNAGTFEFTVPLGNPLYNEIVDHSIITVYEDNLEIWRGDIQDIKQNFDKSLDVYCLEDLAWLGEEAVAMTAINNETYLQRFTGAIASYNANQVAKRQFTQGVLTSVTTTNTCKWQPKYEENLLDCLRNYIADDGHVRIRRVIEHGSLVRYVDIVRLADFGQQADQTIEFGSNLLDFVKEMDNTNFLNVLYPYGKETENELYGDVMQRIVGTPIQNDASIAVYGRRARSVIFETESEAKLNSLALAYLNRYSQPIMKIQVKAVDLGNIELINRIHLGDSVRIIANTFAIDQWDYVTKQDLDFLDIANNQITLSDSVKTRSLTSQVAEQATEIKDIRSPLSVLDEAKKNAMSILQGENGGIVTFEVNGQEQIVGILIANNLDIEQATKAWGWNIKGLCYVHRDYPTDNWTLGIAMNMNGEIVADYITTGEMSADRVRTGKLESHNYSYTSGNYNNSGTIVDMDNGLIRTPGFKADGSGNVFIANGAVIGGYAKDTDIPDVSAYATKAGLAQKNYTVINGGNITTGFMSANHIEGGAFVTGADDGFFAACTSLSFIHAVMLSGGLADTVYELFTVDNSYTIGSYIAMPVITTDDATVNMTYAVQKTTNGGTLWQDVITGIIDKGYNRIPFMFDVTGSTLEYYRLEISTDNYVNNIYINFNTYEIHTLLNSNGGYFGKLIFENSEGSIYKIGYTQLYKSTSRSAVSAKYYKLNNMVSTIVSSFKVKAYFTGEIVSGQSYADGTEAGTIIIQRKSKSGSTWSSLETLKFTFNTLIESSTSISTSDFSSYDYRLSVTLTSVSTYLSSCQRYINTSDYRVFNIGDEGFKGNFTGKIDSDTGKIGYVEYSKDSLTGSNSNGDVLVRPDLLELSDSASNSVFTYQRNGATGAVSGDLFSVKSNNDILVLFDSTGNNAQISMEIASSLPQIYRIGQVSQQVVWESYSDERLKDDIEPLDSDLSRALIDGTQPKKFKFRHWDGKHYGMIAQEVRKTLDELGETDSQLEYSHGDLNVEDERAIKYEEFIPHLINYVKDLRKEIEQLKNIIKEEN